MPGSAFAILLCGKVLVIGCYNVNMLRYPMEFVYCPLSAFHRPIAIQSDRMVEYPPIGGFVHLDGLRGEQDICMYRSPSSALLLEMFLNSRSLTSQHVVICLVKPQAPLQQLTQVFAVPC